MSMTSKKTYGIKECKWCSNEFDAHRSNQIYCSSDCCKKATNKKVIDNYHKNKKRLAGEFRKCDSCGTKLSKYNDKSLCNLCQDAKKDAARIQTLQALGLFSYDKE